MLIAGGLFTPVAELFDPVTSTFSTTGTMNVPRLQHTATLLQDGRVLIVGGFGDTTAEVFDPVTGTFSFTGNMNTLHSSFSTATLLNNGQVLIAGGIQRFSLATAAAELYDPVTGKFALTGSMTTPRGRHTATLLTSGKVLIAGGSHDGIVFSSAELYDPTTGTFSPLPDMQVPRSLFTATRLSNGMVLIAGGLTASETSVAADLYDPIAQTFRATGTLSTARFVHVAALLGDGTVLIAGGIGNGDTVLSSAEIYDPADGAFTGAASMNDARALPTATVLNNGQVLVAGGENATPTGGFQNLETAELFSSGTPQPGITLGQKAASNAIGLLQMPYYFFGAKGYDYAQDLYVTASAISTGYQHCNGKDGCPAFSTQPGIDCSGLIIWSYNTAFGATSNYANSPNPIRYEGASGQCSDPQSKLLTVSNPETDLTPGDLLCFNYHEASGVLSPHVAMYTGGGTVVEAYIGKGVVQSTVSPSIGSSRETFDPFANWSQCSSPASTRCFDFLGYRRPNSAQVGIAFNTHSPVTLNVTDPDGFSINANTSVPSEREIRREVPGQFYYLENANGDDTVIAPQFKRGRYFVQVFPKAQASATETYSLTVDSANGTVLLAQNTPIAQIPAGGYGLDTSSSRVQPFMPVSIDIKPGGIPNSINPRSEGTIPVAILSTRDFNATERVNPTTLTFGHSGDEASFAFCNSEDVNGDGLEDLVCHFFTRLTGFVISDTEGTLKGQTVDSVPIFGTDSVRIVH